MPWLKSSVPIRVSTVARVEMESSVSCETWLNNGDGAISERAATPILSFLPGISILLFEFESANANIRRRFPLTERSLWHLRLLRRGKEYQIDFLAG